jgi:hypothetical protein
MPMKKTATSNSADELLAFCDEVEQQHEPMDDPEIGKACGQCGWGFPCHAIQGARAVRAALAHSEWCDKVATRCEAADIFAGMASVLREMR